MLTASLFTIAKTWKHPKCPSKEEWIKMCCVYIYVGAGGHMLSHVQLFATPWTVAYQALLSMEISWPRILEQLATSFSRGSSWPKDWTCVSLTSPALTDRFFISWATLWYICVCVYIYLHIWIWREKKQTIRTYQTLKWFTLMKNWTGGE